MLPTHLSKSEKRIIRQICRIQLQSLNRILNNDCEDDVLLFCIEGGIQHENLVKAIDVDIEEFEDIIENPLKFFSISGEHKSVAMHLMTHFFSEKKYAKGLRRLRNKLYWIERFNYCLN